MRIHLRRIALLAALFSATSLPLPALAGDVTSSTANQIGDHLKLTVDVLGFIPISTNENVDKSARCAGRGSKFSIINVDNDFTYVKFYDVVESKSSDTCPRTGAAHVTQGSVYKIKQADYLLAQSKTAGIAYGVLAVPFKFRLGEDKKLISSVTVAPYIAGRLTLLQGLGYEMMPVLAAGIGLVPVASADEQSTDTITAFSMATGFTLSSVKDPKYSAGFLFGKDFASKSERARDPGIAKPWVSLWLGVNL